MVTSERRQVNEEFRKNFDFDCNLIAVESKKGKSASNDKY